MTITQALDGVIAISYYSIAFTLFYRTGRDSKTRRRWYLLLSALTLAGGTFYGREALTSREGAIGPGFFLQFMTAAISATSAVVAVPLLPRVASLPSRNELAAANQRMQELIAERKEAEEKLIRAAAFPDQNPNPFVEADLEGQIAYVN